MPYSSESKQRTAVVDDSVNGRLEKIENLKEALKHVRNVTEEMSLLKDLTQEISALRQIRLVASQR
jgi:hypothetical protein